MPGRLLASIAATGWLILVSATNTRAEEWTKPWAVNGKPELRVSTQDASISLEAGSSNEIAAEVITRGISIGGGGVKIFDHQEGNRIELEIRQPVSHFSFGGHSIQLHMRVPRELLADLHTGDGSVKLYGLHGSLRINTGDGSVEGYDLDGALEARSGDGSVHLRGRFDKLQVRTSDGSVDVQVNPGSRMSSDWRVETGDGSIHLKVPRELAATLQLRTGDGSIHTDLPLTVQGMKSEHEMHAKLNGGGPFLEVHTGDGSISIGAI
jgi:Toastrack DUF4097